MGMGMLAMRAVERERLVVIRQVVERRLTQARLRPSGWGFACGR
jgi:hypothetical protein